MERKRTDWDHHIRSFESSDLKAADYCSLHSLNVGTFRSYLYKHRAQNSSADGFREILVNTELSLSIDAHGQLTLSGFEPDVLPTIIRAWSDALSQAKKVFLYGKPVDYRKQINGLAGIVETVISSESSPPSVSSAGSVGVLLPAFLSEVPGKFFLHPLTCCTANIKVKIVKRIGVENRILAKVPLVGRE